MSGKLYTIYLDTQPVNTLDTIGGIQFTFPNDDVDKMIIHRSLKRALDHLVRLKEEITFRNESDAAKHLKAENLTVEDLTIGIYDFHLDVLIDEKTATDLLGEEDG